jgi:pathogenesis-related protein 1
MPPASRFSGVTGLLMLAAVAAVGVVTLVACHAERDARAGTHSQADDFVDAHNRWRRQAGAWPVRWAADLASMAQARAEHLAAHGCLIEHGRLPTDVGENLFHVSPLQHTGGPRDELFVVTAAEVVDEWGAESVDYYPVHDTCAAKRQCGHYAQIVWPATEEVGCGMSVCPTLGQVWVCNYRPGAGIRASLRR